MKHTLMGRKRIFPLGIKHMTGRPKLRNHVTIPFFPKMDGTPCHLYGRTMLYPSSGKESKALRKESHLVGCELLSSLSLFSSLPLPLLSSSIPAVSQRQSYQSSVLCLFLFWYGSVLLACYVVPPPVRRQPAYRGVVCWGVTKYNPL